ncbi:MAG: hypothetical protein KC416_01085, partial [Myxococcales bacterium]|nr:hypothetical protein [Myxococcales bacterium]
MIDRPSVDGQGRPITEYRYRWFRSESAGDGGKEELPQGDGGLGDSNAGGRGGGDGGPDPDGSAFASSFLSHTHTSKNETWNVQVIPIVGARQGRPSTNATASVQV